MIVVIGVPFVTIIEETLGLKLIWLTTNLIVTELAPPELETLIITVAEAISTVGVPEILPSLVENASPSGNIPEKI